MRLLQQAGPLRGGAGEGALHVAEQLGLDEVLGKGGAVDLHERPLGARALGVHGIGSQLLAGAALAHDEYIGVGGGHRVEKLENAAHGGRAAQHLAVAHLLGELATEIRGLGEEVPPLEGLAEQGEHLRGVEGLGDEVEGAFLGRLHRLRDRAVAGHDDHFDVGIAAAQDLEETHAVAVGENEVDEGHGEIGVVHPGGGLRDAHRRLHYIALSLEDQAQAFRDRGLIIHHQDFGLHGASTGSSTLTCVPRPSWLRISMRPPCCSTTERAMAIPSPVPVSFVV